ncbi:MAG: hypothetical protein ACQEW8_04480 [Actinomycetota bacterium]
MEVEPLPDGRGRGRASQAKAARLKALSLRELGLTYEAIGNQLGRSTAWAHKAVQQELNDLNREKAESVRNLELARLDRMQQRHFLSATSGDRAATHTVLRIMERRAKYLDLDNPRLSQTATDASNLLGVLASRLTVMPDTYVPVQDDLASDDLPAAVAAAASEPEPARQHSAGGRDPHHTKVSR